MIEPPKLITKQDWDRCAPWIRAALVYAHGTHDEWDVLKMIHDHEAVFWPFERSVAVTEFRDFPKMRAMHFWLCGGDMKELMQKLPEVEAWGASQGATRFTTAGRPGWQRVMKRYGYQPVWHICSKDLAHV